MGLDWINEIVANLRKNHITNNPYDLCKDLKIEIEKVEPDYYLLAGKKSIYFRNFYDKQIIFIRNDLFGQDEEYALRHELGHAILHPEIYCSSHSNTGKIDKQADYFALALSGVTFDLIEMQDMTLQQIASCIEVPYEPLSQLVNL
jgi:Zn-dependent peptidase ImmA (M78 family)